MSKSNEINKKLEENKKYINKVLNDMKIDNEEKFMNAVANVFFEQNKKNKEYEEIILAMNGKSISYQVLCDFLISSVDETKKPIWTEDHIEELLDNFVVRWK